MRIWHMSGAGNTFAVLDARGQNLAYPTLAKEYCALLGTDGFMALTAAENADFRLHFYNSDGSRAPMCGNGARCICRFAYDNGIAGARMKLETDSGPVWGQRLSEHLYRVQLPQPGGLRLGPVSTVTVGVPHGVLELPGLEFSMAKKLLSQAGRLRLALDANIDFYTRLAPGRVRVLTYERGVEAFTAACGTGCAAVAQVVLGGKPGRITAHNPGGTLTIEVSPAATCLTGPTQVLRVLEI